MEKGDKFRFAGRGQDLFHNGSEMEDGAVEDVGIGFVAKEETTALAAAGTDSIEERGVAVKFEDHVAGVVADCAGGVGGAVVEKLVARAFGGVGSSCLSGGEFTEGSE